MRFDGSEEQSFDEDDIFYLGMLTHFNWPVNNNTAAKSAELQITLDFSKPNIPDQTFTYNFDIDETSNSAGSCPDFQQSLEPCDDKITFPESYATEVIVINHVKYTLVIKGFVDAFPQGDLLNAFITEEKKNSTAYLVGQLSSTLVPVPAISIEKETNNLDITSEENAPTLFVGDTVTWKYVVQNTGTADLHDIFVTDKDIARNEDIIIKYAERR